MNCSVCTVCSSQRRTLVAFSLADRCTPASSNRRRNTSCCAVYMQTKQSAKQRVSLNAGQAGRGGCYRAATIPAPAAAVALQQQTGMTKTGAWLPPMHGLGAAICLCIASPQLINCVPNLIILSRQDLIGGTRVTHSTQSPPETCAQSQQAHRRSCAADMRKASSFSSLEHIEMPTRAHRQKDMSPFDQAQRHYARTGSLLLWLTLFCCLCCPAASQTAAGSTATRLTREVTDLNATPFNEIRLCAPFSILVTPGDYAVAIQAEPQVRWLL